MLEREAIVQRGHDTPYLRMNLFRQDRSVQRTRYTSEVGTSIGHTMGLGYIATAIGEVPFVSSNDSGKPPIRRAAGRYRAIIEDAMIDQIASPLMTESESAKYLRICARGLWGIRDAGQIGYVKVGSRVFYRQEQLDQYIAQNERAPLVKTEPEVGTR